MHKDVEQYFADLDAAKGDLTELEQAAQEAAAAYAEADRKLMEGRSLRGAAIRTAEREGRLALCNSEDPAVAWIANRALENYPEHSREILKLLPASVDVLEKHAQDNGWCSDWDRYLNRAEEAGVIKREEAHPALEPVLAWIKSNYGTSYTRSFRPQLVELVRAVQAAPALPTEGETEAK